MLWNRELPILTQISYSVTSGVPASVRVAPLIWIGARDRLLSGRGNMLVKLYSIFPIANASGAEIDQGSRARWIAEAVWIPYAFVGGCIRWDAIDERSARATLTGQDGLSVSLLVEIDEEGKLTRIRGERFRHLSGGRAVMTAWGGRCSEYREFNGFRIPSFVEVGWDLEGGEFSYVRFRVTAIEYNIMMRF